MKLAHVVSGININTIKIGPILSSTMRLLLRDLYHDHAHRNFSQVKLAIILMFIIFENLHSVFRTWLPRNHNVSMLIDHRKSQRTQKIVLEL